MDPNLFNVIFTGRLLDGFTSDEVVKAFSSKFKIPEAKALKVINANKEVVLKPRAEHVKAYKFKSALEALGLEVRLERAAMVTAVKPEPKPEPTVEKTQTANQTVKEKTTQNPKPQATGNASWSLEPIAKEPDEVEEKEDPVHIHPAYQTRQVEQETPNQDTLEDIPEEPIKTTESGRTVGDLIKTIGGVVAAGIGVIFIAVKKFGLFKVLKIGGLMTAAAFAGYDPEEICMGNGMCEDAIDEQIDDCWEQSGMDAYDWDNMPVDQYLALKPKIENDFVSCFVYEDTGQRVLESPLEIRFDLIDNCYETDKKNCISLAETQLKSCYAANNIDALVSTETMDFYQAVYEYPKAFKSYYGCFLDEAGQPLFSDVLAYWDEIYNSDYY
jgi:hypothetical protein